MGVRHAGLALIAAIGCGRLNFDPAGPPIDARPAVDAALPCPLATSAPDPLVIDGTTVQVSTFGQYSVAPSVLVSIVPTSTGTSLASVTSNSVNGTFSVAVPSGGRPLTTIIRLEKAGLLTTLMVPDQAVDINMMLGATAFLSTSGAADTLYSAGSVTRDLARGTVLVQVRECNGTPIDGATLTFTPAPERIIYASNLGAPTATATTTGTTGHGWALNLPSGVVEVTASKDGRVFAVHDVEIVAGDTVMFTVVRPLI